MDKIHICSFSGSVSDLTVRQRADILIVLGVLAKDPRVSAWDMDDGKPNPLWKTIKVLQDAGYIDAVEQPYPWLRFEVTKKGKTALEATNEQAA